jgi:hypothetical protein
MEENTNVPEIANKYKDIDTPENRNESINKQ